jgi:hypothetical protein
MPSATRASLNGRAAGVLVGLEDEFHPVGVLRRDDRQPAVLAHGDLRLLLEAQHIGVEAQCFGLVVHHHAGEVDSHVLSSF